MLRPLVYEKFSPGAVWPGGVKRHAGRGYYSIAGNPALAKKEKESRKDRGITILKEAPIRVVTTDYDHHYLEIPTEGWKFTKRWDWIKSILTGGDIVHRSRMLQIVDLRTPHSLDDSHEMP